MLGLEFVDPLQHFSINWVTVESQLGLIIGLFPLTTAVGIAATLIPSNGAFLANISHIMIPKLYNYFSKPSSFLFL